MKTLFLILFLAPLLVMGQNDSGFVTEYTIPNVFKLWKEYLYDCNQLVPDTIKQAGVVNVKYKPVIVNGEISHYLLTPVDTVWKEAKCNKYKNDDGYLFSGAYLHVDTTQTTWLKNITYTNLSAGYTPIEQVNNKINITRNKICHIKDRKASWDDFWDRWLVEKKIIEMN